MPDLSAMLKSSPVVCAEGYLFECERRGYLQAGAFVPEVVLDHPEVVEELHREFVHAGSDVVEAFTYYGHRQKLRVIGKEDILEPLNRQALAIAAKVARETGTLLAGNVCNTNTYEPGTGAADQARATSRSRWPGPPRRAPTWSSPRRSAGWAKPSWPWRRSRPPARGGDLRRPPGRHLARRGQPGGGLPPGRAGRRHRGRPQLHPRAADHAAAARADPRRGVVRGGGAARALPDDRGAAVDAGPARSRAGRGTGLPHRARPLRLHPPGTRRVRHRRARARRALPGRVLWRRPPPHPRGGGGGGQDAGLPLLPGHDQALVPRHRSRHRPRATRNTRPICRRPGADAGPSAAQPGPPGGTRATRRAGPAGVRLLGRPTAASRQGKSAGR